jgi:hypothetical protein
MIASLHTSQKLDKNKSKIKLRTQTRFKKHENRRGKRSLKFFKRFHKRPERNENTWLPEKKTIPGSIKK